MLSWFRRARSEAEPVPQKPEAATAKEAPTPSGPLAVPSRAGVLAHETDAMDYLATPALAAYFDAREHEAYYQALKRIGPRRDFHERLVPVLERFIELTDSPRGAAAVDRVMAGSLRVEQAARAPVMASHWRSPGLAEGTELLGLTEPLTFDSLKAAYRSAARRNHPDAGGSHDAMVTVNEVFQFVHALLREREIAAGVDGTKGIAAAGVVEVRNCFDYRYSCGELLFLAALDDWSATPRSCGWNGSLPRRGSNHLMRKTLGVASR